MRVYERGNLSFLFVRRERRVAFKDKIGIGVDAAVNPSPQPSPSGRERTEKKFVGQELANGKDTGALSQGEWNWSLGL
ncbi:MAG: hypothetical protein QOI77_93 [Blastocatellia bacterium]|nr:hypothetical protein [Blastocatellia bacterium]